jgi:hypothetical protein
MLQDSLSTFPASGGSSQVVIESLLVAVGRILAESLKYPNDVARHHALRSVAAALTQALVPNTQNKIKDSDSGDGRRGDGISVKKQKRSEMEKIINMNSSTEVLDWDAAALASHNALLTPTAAKIQLPPQSCSTTTHLVDSLLQRALTVPSMDSITGRTSALLQTAQHVALPSFSASGISIYSQAARVSYFTLNHPHALEQSLSTILAHAAESTTKVATLQSIIELIDSNSEYTAAIEAIAASPPLHIEARKILRSWLATTANMNIWLLHCYLFNISSSFSSTSSSSSNRVFPEGLYDGFLRQTAECVFEACRSVEPTEDIMSDSNNLSSKEKVVGVLPAVLDDVRQNSRNGELVSLLLDAHELTTAALQQLSWAKHVDDGNEDVSAMDARYFTTPVPQEVAEWLALVMWPFHTCQHRILSDAMVQNNSAGEVSQHVQKGISILKTIWCPSFLLE